MPCAATANWIMVDYLANCTKTASAWTRIYTFLVDASFVERTFGAGYTFGSTCWRTTNVAYYARANCLTVYCFALTVRSARGWLTWVYCYRCRNWRAENKSISNITRDTGTNWNVINYCTFCILSASTRTRIFAFVSDASFSPRTITIENTFRPATLIGITLIFR